MSLSDAAKVMQTQYEGEDTAFTGVSTDTRTIEKDQLFVALTGENFNGHEFIEAARQKGAAAALVSEQIESDLPHLTVSNTLTGMQMLAHNWRLKFDIPVVAITGSNGKTTVKELLGAILNAHYQDVLVTQGNLNNHIGVPLTLLRLTKAHQCAVIEMGMNHAGEISQLTHLAKPSVALVNNAMLAHVEAFDSVADVARAKSEIFEALDERGVAVVNADDENYPLFKQLAGSHKLIDFALDGDAQVTAKLDQRADPLEMVINSPIGSINCRLNLLGKHNARNALAAVGCAVALDIGLQSIKQGLESVMPVNGRLQLIKPDNGCLVLNDTYNANPDSMKAGIDVLADLTGSNKVLIAGDMGELGKTSAQLHRQIGRYARQKSIDEFLSFGPLMQHAAQAFGEHAFNTQDIDALILKAKEHFKSNAVMLIKGSRSMKMERVVAALVSSESGGMQ